MDLKFHLSVPRTIWHLIPIMMTFFAMGFVDLISVAVNYLQADFGLSDTMANLFATLTFAWFFLCAVPSALLMNVIGRKKTVLWSVFLTLVAGILPLIDESLMVAGVSFSILGIANTMMQVSLNPLLLNLLPRRVLSGAMTFGSFCKALSALSAPFLTGWCASALGNWRYVFGIFWLETFFSFVLLTADQIRQEPRLHKNSGFWKEISLLGKPYIALSFVAVLCHVGLDVGLSVSIPKILMDRLKLSLDVASRGISLYFLCRTIGSLIGAYLLVRFPIRKIYLSGPVFLLLGLSFFAFGTNARTLYTALILLGLGNANIFSILVAQAMLSEPENKNVISGLMMTAIGGGAVFPLLTGMVADLSGSRTNALSVLLFCVVYLGLFTKYLRVDES